MKTFFKVIQYILMFLGGLFIIEVIIVAWFLIADPLNLFDGGTTGLTDSEQLMSESDSTSTKDKNPLLTPEQEAFAESIGIDPETLPSEITPEMEECLRAAVGDERADQISNGAAPTTLEIIKARDCL
jgi:predicted metalloprotease